uniref:Uncharacterized protein n=1 Tax=Zea mays TaxID=4577 RepID=A0A804PVH4_MAIZE
MLFHQKNSVEENNGRHRRRLVCYMVWPVESVSPDLCRYANCREFKCRLLARSHTDHQVSSANNYISWHAHARTVGQLCCACFSFLASSTSFFFASTVVVVSAAVATFSSALAAAAGFSSSTTVFSTASSSL